ncbi:MAG: secretion protein HlyD [Acidobacteria bacterium]|jgi:HlyD family secretion protein|nr:secretion protein HlyD [Acidobacteriota bacterium]
MRRRRWILALLALIVVAAAVVSMRRAGGAAVDVTAEPARRQAVFRASVTASGEIVATRYADIGSSVMGKIVELNVKEGDTVKAGQVLARIDPVQARADLTAAQAFIRALESEALAADEQVRAAQADRAFAAARLGQADLELKRARDLHEQQLLPRSELDARQAEYDSAAAQLKAAEAAIDRARNTGLASQGRVGQARAQATRARDVVSKTEVTSPMNGVVSRLQVREGEMVVIGIQNQPGTVLMTVSDLSAIDAEVKVAEADVLRLKLGQAATVVLEALPGREFRGRVVEIGASALPVTGAAAAAREFRVLVRLDQADAALRPGLTCDVEILTDERANVISVPLQSVVLRPAGGGAVGSGREQPGVFVVEDERARFTPVKTGIIGGLDMEVSGLDEKALVVSGPYQALRDLADGARIRVQTSTGR